jgi:hypothetical protein
MTLDVGVRVRLVGQGDAVCHVNAVETRNDLTFYRLREKPGALFLASSLEVVE